MNEISIIFRESDPSYNGPLKPLLKSLKVQSFELYSHEQLIKEVAVLKYQYTWQEQIDFHQRATRKETLSININFLMVDGVILFGDIK